MSLYSVLMADEEDPFFGSHMRRMRHMNNMMNMLFSDPFGMMGGGGSPLALSCPHHNNSLMPFMPPLPSINRLFSADYDGGHMSPGGVMSPAGHLNPGGHMGAGGHMSAGSSYSSTIVMSSGPNGKPQLISSSSSTKIGPNGIKETRNTLQDSRTGTKKMSIGHHIGERAHVVEREQNYYSGEAEERQEFINIEEDEAEDFDREFQTKAGSSQQGRQRLAIQGRHSSPPPQPRLALPAPPSHSPTATVGVDHTRGIRPTARRPLRSSPLAAPRRATVRDVYGGSHPQSHRHRHSKPSRHQDN